MKPLIYLDHAATTAVRKEALDAMMPYFMEHYSNPSSMYQSAFEAKEKTEEARAAIASLIGASADEIYFTGGGSESDNWAIKGVAQLLREKGRHIITTAIEHHAVLHTCQWLSQQGYEVTYLPVDSYGMVSPESVEEAIRPDTILISVMYANNEIGTIEPIREIGAIARKHGIFFHTDAVQAFAHVPIHVGEEKIDLLSASAHKFGGPKGVGFLYVRSGILLEPLLHGGAQERGRRAGTTNVPGIVGMGTAAVLAAETMQERMRYESALRDAFVQRILSEIPDVKRNGHPEQCLPGIANFCFSSVEGESVLLLLDLHGICASSGSACASGSEDPSHVLLAAGVSRELARGSVRFSLSQDNTKEEMDFVIDCLKDILSSLREISHQTGPSEKEETRWE